MSVTRKLNDLAPECRPIFFELLARLTEAGIMVQIIDVLRTVEEQKVNLAKGVSATMNSRHLPQPPSGLSHAIDLCPYSIYALHGPDKLQWDSSDPVWGIMGPIGEALGLRWGGRWKSPYDVGHWEWNPASVPRVINPLMPTNMLG
jgi:hypothetical protein